jgi:hypothetical protein
MGMARTTTLFSAPSTASSTRRCTLVALQSFCVGLQAIKPLPASPPAALQDLPLESLALCHEGRAFRCTAACPTSTPWVGVRGTLKMLVVVEVVVVWSSVSHCRRLSCTRGFRTGMSAPCRGLAVPLRDRRMTTPRLSLGILLVVRLPPRHPTTRMHSRTHAQIHIRSSCLPHPHTLVLKPLVAAGTIANATSRYLSLPRAIFSLACAKAVATLTAESAMLTFTCSD